MSSYPIEYPIEVSVFVRVEYPRILVRTRFENKGDRPILVKEGEYGYGSGDQDRTCSTPGAPGNPEFTIVTDRHDAIRYKGWLTHRARPTRALFKPIEPGQVVDVRCTELNDSYAFLPGTHAYKISHTHLALDEGTGEIVAHQSGETAFTFTGP